MARVSIEDCQKVMPNRFALVVVAANRARQLMGSSSPLIHSKNKHAVTALREIAEGMVVMKGDFGSTADEDVAAAAAAAEAGEISLDTPVPGEAPTPIIRNLLDA